MRVMIVSLLLLSPVLALAQSGDGPYGNKYRINKLAPDVYTLTWDVVPGVPAIGTATFIVGGSDVIVVDTGLSKSAGEAILGGLRQVTDKPVATVINTHWHGDHIFGNQAFKAAFPHARFIAHPETRAGIITGEIDYRAANRPKFEARIAELRAKPSRSEGEARELAQFERQVDAWQGDYVLPDLLVDQRLTIVQGDRKIEVMHLGHANTKGDLVVYLPAERIVVSGDMAITPVPFGFFSSPRAWIPTLDKLAAIDAATIVPGHGQPQTDKQFIRDLQAMLRSIVEQVDAGRKAGRTLDELKKSVTLTPPSRSIYATVKPESLDRLFRIPAVESAFNEK
ncbi:MAG TPA: MBL fold metallo-hydrolase [Vicinamibacterales bacterium]|nr:MBL fold metallo-hydrolase [Vicinamibacterales bacterium]